MIGTRSDGLDRPLLVAPAPLLAIAALLINDHVLKGLATGDAATWLTGKLSDVAGLVYFPLLLLALLEPAFGPLRGRRHVRVAAIVTGLGFAAVKLWPIATAAYGITWGAMQWVALASIAAAIGDDAPHLLPVACVADPTDLLALAGLAIPWFGRDCDSGTGADRGEARRKSSELAGEFPEAKHSTILVRPI